MSSKVSKTNVDKPVGDAGILENTVVARCGERQAVSSKFASWKLHAGTLTAIMLTLFAVPIAQAQSTQEVADGFALLPEPDAVIGTTTGGGLNFSTESGGSLNYSINGPLQKRENGWVLYDFGYSSSLDSDMATEGAALTAGVIYRSYLDDETIFGVNAYLEAGRRSDLEDFMGLASLGVEYEKRPEEWTGSFVQAGGNFYVPLDDYTNIDEYGLLSSAPRMGLDGYASFGRSFDGYSWLGSVYGFNYFETDAAFDLTGYAAEGAVEWTRGLPRGWTATGSLGIQDDSRAGQEPALYAGLKLDYTFGGGNGDVLPARDCALVRGEDGATNVDCSEAVIPNASGTLLAKDGSGISSSLGVRTARVVRPRRHVGFGTPYTPIEYTDQPSTLQIVKLTASDADNTFNFTSSVAALSTAITTIGGSGTSSAITVDAGTYSISEISLPDGYTLADVACTGATSFAPDLATDSVNVTVASGQDAVCTFNNGFVEPVAPTGTVQLIKSVVGDAAPVQDFVFTSSIAALNQTLSGAGGVQTIPGAAVTVDAGIYTITEAALPAGWSLTGASCPGADFTPIAGGVSVTIDAEEAVVCTFTNTYTAPVVEPGCLPFIITNNYFDANSITLGGVFGDPTIPYPPVEVFAFTSETLACLDDSTPVFQIQSVDDQNLDYIFSCEPDLSPYVVFGAYDRGFVILGDISDLLEDLRELNPGLTSIECFFERP